jgi:hypothetical protein
MAHGQTARASLTAFAVFFVGCTVTITPIPQKQLHQKPSHHARHQLFHRSSPTPTPHLTPIPGPPNPSVSPLPPDPRIIDIIRQLEEHR